ncbi:phospholipid carrier-dependent glycosyltransferase [Streptomyces sp. NBC_01558]|uniref:phospholipid carrier-dependent glycosyltransferase n=1 Tax=Streptomyces sp. NBC_01558 TaxID=2975878 RepID=UPI003FA3A959
MASRHDDRVPVGGEATSATGRWGGLRRHRRALFAVAVVLLLAQMTVAMVTSAVEQTPTIDEPVYAGTAVVYVQQHSLRYNPEHPPLGKLIIGGGMLFARPQLDLAFRGDQTELGRHLLYESGNDPWRVMLWARLPVIVLTLLFGLVVLAFTRELVGRVGALTALALYAFSPDVIAHGSLATLDVPASGFLLTSVWLVWRARRRPRLYVPLAGLALGAALATKMSTLPAVPVLLLLAVLSVRHAGRPAPDAAPRDGGRAGPRLSGTGVAARDDEAVETDEGVGKRPPARPLVPGGDEPVEVRPPRSVGAVPHRTGGALRLLGSGAVAAAGMALVAVATVWAAYLAVDPRLRWTAPADLPAVHGLRALAVDLLPLPQPYRDGMRIQFGFENTVWQGFLFGRLYRGSLWYYLPAALLVKTPLGMAALWAAGTAALTAVRRLRPAVPYLLLPPVVLLAAAMTGSRDLGVRYALFVPVFLAVVAGCAVVVRRRWAGIGAAALVLFVAVSSLLAYPYYLPYSNEAFGGPAETRLRLHDSNVDWGQDLGRLADRLREEHPHEKVWLVYKGAGVPAAYGIDAADPRTVPPGRVHGLLVVSDSAIAKADARLKALLAGGRRIDDVGHSITVFRRP